MSRRKKVLIINAGFKQLPMLRWAKQKGYYTLVADSRPEMLCFTEADEVLPIAPFETDALVAAAADKKIDAVCYTTSENPIPLVRRIADHMGLHHNLPDKVVRASCDKLAMREILADAGIQDVAFRRAASPEEVEGFVAENGYPVVLKLTGSGNQIGMFVLQRPEQWQAQSAAVSAALSSGDYLVERLHSGVEINAVALFVEGELHRHLVSDRLHYGAAHRYVAYEHRFPSTLPPGLVRQAEAKSRAIGRALGVRNAIVFIQYIVADQVVRTVELGVRVPGGMMWQMFRWATGIDLMETWLEMSVRPEFSRAHIVVGERYPAVSIRFLSAFPGPLQTGRLLSVDGLDAARSVEGVCFADFYNKFKQIRPPEAVPPLKDGSDRFFCIVSTGSSYERARHISLSAEGRLCFHIESTQGEEHL